MSWTPDGGLMTVALELVARAQQPPADPKEQLAISQALDAANRNPDFTVYLIHIMANPSAAVPVPVRHFAGLGARTNIDRVFTTLPEAAKTALKAMVLEALADPSNEIASTACNIIATIARQPVELEKWPECLARLVQMLDGDERSATLSLKAVCQLLEDDCTTLDSDKLGRPLNALFPRLVKFTGAPSAELRQVALQGALNAFIDSMGAEDMPLAVTTNAEMYLGALAARTSDPDEDVRLVVCSSLCAMLDKLPTHVGPNLPTIVDFFVHTCSNDTYRVKLEACEFWDHMCSLALEDDSSGLAAEANKLMIEKLPVLVPMFIKLMVYSEEELAELPVENTPDAAVPDKPEDIRPFRFRGHDEDRTVNQWTLRRAACDTFGTIAQVWPRAILPHFTATINECFKSVADDMWLPRETGILALGVTAEALGAMLGDHLSPLLGFLISQLSDPRPLIRSTAAWTIGMFADLISLDDKAYSSVYTTMMSLCLDPVKAVQGSALTVIWKFAECEDTTLLLPHIEATLQLFQKAFDFYQVKNLLALYDTIGAFAENLPHVLCEPKYQALLLPPLIHRWNTTGDEDLSLAPLMEMLVFVISALPSAFEAPMPEMLKRSMSLLEDNLILVMAARAVEGEAPPDKEHIIAAIDLIAALGEYIPSAFESNITPHHAKLMPMIMECCRPEESRSVRQSAFALIGVMAMCSIALLKPHLDTIYGYALQNISPATPKVTNNSCWAIGEISLRIGREVGKYAPAMMTKATVFFQEVSRYQVPQSVFENMACFLSRAALQVPDVFSPEMPKFFYNWLRAGAIVSSPSERDHVYMGICNCVGVAPRVVEPFFSSLLEFLTVWPGSTPPSADLQKTVAAMFEAMKASSAEPLMKACVDSPEHVARARALWGASVL